MKKYGTTSAILLMLLVVLVFSYALGAANHPAKQVGFSDVLLMLDDAIAHPELKTATRVTNVVITGQDETVQFKTNKSPKVESLFVPSAFQGKFLELAKQAHVTIETKGPSQMSSSLNLLGVIVVPILILLSFVLMLLRGSQSGGHSLNFGRSKAKLMIDSKVKVRFQDVAGIDEAKRELQEVVDFLKNPEKFQALGARIPRGVLLVGSPGTGKTLMAKAVAGEAGVPFFSISGSDFVEMFVGVGASRVRDLFAQAKKQAPCIVFVDEIDAVGRQRGAGTGGASDEREQTLNQLLVEMDGFEGSTGIIIVAATNRPDILDKALLRPGRFDRQVVLDPPDVLGREQILNVHSSGKPLSKNVELKTLAKRTPGFTGADLSNLLNEAALIAARHDRQEIAMNDLELAIDKILAGPEKRSRIMPEKEKEMTAYHEVGHALMCHLLENAHPLHKVTIIPRGFALGLTMYLPEEERLSTTKDQIIDTIAVCLGGRIAEENIYGENKITTGAQNDLEKSTSLARRMVTEFGMSERLGPITFGKRSEQSYLGRDSAHERDYGDRVAEIIDEEVKRIISEQYDRVKLLLHEYEDHMHELVKALLEKETLDRYEFSAIVRRVNQEKGWPNPADDYVQEEEAIANTPSNSNEPATVINIETDKPTDKPDLPSSGLRPSFA